MALLLACLAAGPISSGASGEDLGAPGVPPAPTVTIAPGTRPPTPGSERMISESPGSVMDNPNPKNLYSPTPGSERMMSESPGSVMERTPTR